MTYPVQYFRGQTVRDLFVTALKSPFDFLTERNKTTHILKGVSLSIRRGERVALIGVNGSGKTSLCRCLSGVLRPSKGEIQKNCLVRAVIQTESGFYQELTGRENAWIISQFIYPDLTIAERAELIAEVLEFSELGSYVDVPLENYSMGMKSRLSLSLITAKSAELLILDEVANHADEFFRKKLNSRMREQINKAQAVIVVSHYETDLVSLCDRGIVLDKGRVAYDGSVDKAIKAYRFLNGAEYV